MHKYIFQDMYEWAGHQRKLNIYKEKPVLGGLSVEYSDMFDIPKDAEHALTEMRGKSWNDMDTHHQALINNDNLQYLCTFEAYFLMITLQ